MGTTSENGKCKQKRKEQEKEKKEIEKILEKKKLNK